MYKKGVKVLDSSFKDNNLRVFYPIVIISIEWLQFLIVLIVFNYTS